METQGARQTGSYQPIEQAVGAKVSTVRLAEATQRSDTSLSRNAGHLVYTTVEEVCKRECCDLAASSSPWGHRPESD